MEKELIKHLDQAFSWLSQIRVSGEDVDKMAMARQELRSAFRITTALSEKKEGEDG